MSGRKGSGHGSAWRLGEPEKIHGNSLLFVGSANEHDEQFHFFFFFEEEIKPKPT